MWTRAWAVAATIAATALGPLSPAHAAAMTVIDINSSVSPATNAAGTKPTLTVHGTNIPAGTTLQLTPTFAGPTDPNAIPLSGPLTAPATTVSADGTTWTGVANLSHATAGDYAVALVSGPNTAECTCTFTINTAGAPSPGPQVTPAKAAQGGSFVMKIPDDAATPGASVSFSGAGVTVTGPAKFGSAGDCTGRCIVVPVTIAPDAKMDAARDVIVTDLPQSQTDTANVGKCTGCLTLEAGPTLGDPDPSALGQGAATTLTLNGTNFASNAVVTFATGITATDKPTITSTKITVPVKVASTAPATVAVTVTNPDYGTASKSLTINPGPTVTTVSPQYVAKDFSGTLTLTGTGFATGAVLTFPDKSGVSVPSGSTPTISADGTSYSVPIKVSRTDQASLDVTVTNTDHGTATCAQCLVVALEPGDVTNEAATRSDTSVTVNWTAPADGQSGGAPITGYTVSVVQPSGTGIKPQTVTTTSATFSGLSSKLNYTFKIVATNAAALSSPGVVASTGGQDAGTVLTLKSAVTQIVAGQHVSLSGHLLDAGKQPIVAATVLVTARDLAGQTRAVGTAATDGDGNWLLQVSPKQNVTYTASFAGNDQNASATATPLKVTVAPRITISAAKKSSSTHRLVVTGTVTPNKAGKAVHLTAVDAHGVKKDLGTTTLSGTSSYKFRVKLGKGTWTLVVSIAKSSGNTAGHSKGLTLHRT